VPDTESRTFTIPLTPPQAVDAVSAELFPPVGDHGDGLAAVLLAHGAGTDRRNPLLRTVAAGLAAAGHPVVLFNFGYTEAAGRSSGSGRRRPDPAPRLEAVWDAVVADAGRRLPGRPLVLGGRSMGGRIASHVAAAGTRCDGLAFLGYPLHPPGRPERLRTAHWPQLRCPVLFLHGDRDTFGTVEELERARAAHLGGAPSVVHVLRGADHGFKVRKADGRTGAEVLDEVVQVMRAWLSPLAAEGGR
jgi:uncharacterized protein